MSPSAQERRPSREQRTFVGALCARPYAALGLFLALLYLPWIAALPMDGTLEGNRLEAAREMLRDGEWSIPRLDGEVYLSKPPLHPWTLAVVSAPFGDVSLATGRIVSALSAILLAMLVLAWVRREIGRRAASFAAIALGCSAHYADKAVRAELESELALLVGVALFCFWDAATARDVRRARWLRAISGFALGGALLVKGPPALIVFAAAALPVSVWSKERRAFATAAAWAIAIAIPCAAAWVLVVCAKLGFGAVWSSFHDQFLERIVRAGPTNVEPFWYYPPAVLAGLLPASLFFPCLALLRRSDMFRTERDRARAMFLWSWALLPLFLFSFSAGKETRYLLPTFAAWTSLLAWGWTRARTAERFVAWRRWLARSLAAASWVLPLLWLPIGMHFFPGSRPIVVASAAVFAIATACLRWSARAVRPVAAIGALALLVLTSKFAWAGTALAKERRAIPIEEIGEEIAAYVPPDGTWILVGPYKSWWQFAANRRCASVPSWSALRDDVASGSRSVPAYALVRASEFPTDERDVERIACWSLDRQSFCFVRLER